MLGFTGVAVFKGAKLRGYLTCHERHRHRRVAAVVVRVIVAPARFNIQKWSEHVAFLPF